MAWAIALFSAILLVVAVVYWISHGIFQPIHLAYVSAIVTGLVGAVVVSQHPRNIIGWWMLAATLVVAIQTVAYDYGYSALHDHALLPSGPIALWLASWLWIPTVGLGYGWIIARFPDGRLPRGWWLVDWLSFAGTAVLVIGLAFAPGPLYPSLLIDNPYGIPSASTELAISLTAGVGLIAAAAMTAYWSLIARYRRAGAVVRQQLKWILFATAIAALTLGYGAVLKIAAGANFTAALTPFAVALGVLPVAIGFAMYRSRLFDVDLVINRTLVYATITAILGGVYVAGIELTQRLFVFYTGQKSDTAIVITAFVVATVFTPVQKWAEAFVERRLGGRDPAGRLDAMSSNVESIIRVIDPHRIARWIVEESVRVFDADGGELYLDSHDVTRPFHVAGRLTGLPAIEVGIHHEKQQLGRLLLGHRRNSTYSDRDRAAIQRSADVLGEALAVAGDIREPSHHQPAAS
ncbi:MAG TPA: hypothetical protein VF383_03530 [Candidatus Dormibacteraeota bacterium]